MNEYDCMSCKKTISADGSKFCYSCEKDHYYKSAKHRYGKKTYEAYENGYSYLYDEQVEHDRYERERVQKEKQRRLEAAVQKECSGCNQTTWHDPDDYMCIVCRDGREALPDGAYMPGMTQAA